jgi:hypothetical protein
MDAGSLSSNDWNVEQKRCKSTNDTCVYKQVYNINPLMGGFSEIGDSLESSSFDVYQFTGEYKIGAQGNTLTLTTTESCSQASISFARALVVFQPIVTPQKASTICKQEVEFIEENYTMVISPFEQYNIKVGTMIMAVDDQLIFTTFKLPSRTDQSKISKALYDFIRNGGNKEYNLLPLALPPGSAQLQMPNQQPTRGGEIPRRITRNATIKPNKLQFVY